MTSPQSPGHSVYPPPMDLPKLNSVEEVVHFLRRCNHRLYVRPVGEIPHSSGPWYVVRTRTTTSEADPFVRIHRAESETPEARTLGGCFDGLMQGMPIAEVPESVCKQIESKLDSDDDIRWHSTRPISRCFVYLDISDYSTYPPGQQLLMLAALPQLVKDTQVGHRPEHTGTPKHVISSGDGYIFVFLDPEPATWFAAQLATRIEHAVAKKTVPVEIHFRMGVHIGEVFPFEEDGIPEKWNLAGDGINGGKRVIDAIGPDADDLVFLSGEVVTAIYAKADYPTGHAEILDYLVNRGRRKDKHGRAWRVYELNHRDAAWGTGKAGPS